MGRNKKRRNLGRKKHLKSGTKFQLRRIMDILKSSKLLIFGGITFISLTLFSLKVVLFERTTIENNYYVNSYYFQEDLALRVVSNGVASAHLLPIKLKDIKNDVFVSTKSEIPHYPLFEKPAGLDSVCDKIVKSYEGGRYRDAVEFAQIGYDMLSNSVAKIENKNYSIKIDCARKITMVYCMLAESAWGQKRYGKANKFINTAINLWGGAPPGDVYAIKVAMAIEKSKKMVALINDETIQYMQGVNKSFIEYFIRQLANWGYIGPIGICGKTHQAIYIDWSKIFNLNCSLKTPGMFKAKVPKDNEFIESELISIRRYIGMGKYEMSHVPNPGEHGRNYDGTTPLHLVSSSSELPFDYHVYFLNGSWMSKGHK